MRTRIGTGLTPAEQQWIRDRLEPFSKRRQEYATALDWLKHTRFRLKRDGTLDLRAKEMERGDLLDD